MRVRRGLDWIGKAVLRKARLADRHTARLRVPLAEYHALDDAWRSELLDQLARMFPGDVAAFSAGAAVLLAHSQGRAA